MTLTDIYLSLVWKANRTLLNVSLFQVMGQIPEVTLEMVQKLEEKVFRNPKIVMSDKLKKEQVKMVIKPVCMQLLGKIVLYNRCLS